MTDYEFLLADRISKIKSINDRYDLSNKAYLSFSGGKDSTVLHYLIDEALPGNSIPRVYFNTGIEYKAVLNYVKSLSENDERIIIVNSDVNIKSMLEEVGYPFKSKEHSLYLSVYQNSGISKSVKKYLERTDTRFQCPDKLKYQFTDDFKLKISNKCCFKLKKEIGEKWSAENNRNITITGMRKGEGGFRSEIKGCTIFADDDCKVLKKFHPLLPIESQWVEEFIKQNDIKLCELYYPPYNFQRTGCVCCPYAIDLQEQLDKLALLLPNERKRAEIIWKPVYKEYRRIGYRLDTRPNLFDDLVK